MNSCALIPRIGLPSDLILKRGSKMLFRACAALMFGAWMQRCIRLHLISSLYIKDISVPRINFILLSGSFL